jgi:hypothetical protein
MMSVDGKQGQVRVDWFCHIEQKILNPKHEMRNPKQYRMTEIEMPQTKDTFGIAM